MTAPRTVAIFGSCITRDNFNSAFNPDYRRWYSVSAAANQSSVIALMSPPIEPEVTDADGLAEYDAWNVRSDLSRSFLAELAEARPNYLILDFFGDVHFGLLQLQDGRYATNNRWKLHQTAQYRSWRADGTIASTSTVLGDPVRYYELWTRALDEFAAFVAARCPDTEVIVHRGFYADRATTGPTGRPEPLRKHATVAKVNVRRINKFWARLDEYAVTTHGWASIDLRHERYTSTVEHKWGPFWVHYTADYYHRFLAELNALDLAARLSPDLAEQVALVAAATRERNAGQAQFVRAATRELDTRIKALEQRSVVAAVRAAIRGPR